jgi:hypothetical protein
MKQFLLPGSLSGRRVALVEHEGATPFTTEGSSAPLTMAQAVLRLAGTRATCRRPHL